MSTGLLRTAPQDPLRISGSGMSTQYIQEIALVIQSLRQKQRDIVARISPEVATFENVLLPQIHLQNELECYRGVLLIYSMLPALKESYTSARQATKMVTDFESTAYKDVAMYKLVNTLVATSDNLDSESQRYLTLTNERFIQNGVGITSSSLNEEFQQTENELNELREAYREEYINDDSGVWLDREDMEGLPETITAHWETRGAGQRRLCFKSTDVSLILSLLKDETMRKNIYVAHDNVRADNVARLERAVTLRDQAARLLGYSSHASRKLQNTMAKSPQTVSDFLHNMMRKLLPLMKRDLDRLLELKSDDLGEKTPRLYLWDWSFYNRLRSSRDDLTGANCKFIEDIFAEFFPLSATVQRVLDMIGDLFGIEFENITHMPDLIIWHSDVLLYAAWDADRDAEFLGFLYLDLVERDGKSRGEAHSRVNPGFKASDGTRHYPVSAIRCSFTKAADRLPTLLSCGQLRKLVHEIGHAVHNLVSRTSYGQLHGTNVARDFVEIPSLVLEKWVMDPATLIKLGFHYANLSSNYLAEWRIKSGNSNDTPPTSIPEYVICGLLNAERHKGAKFYLTQVHYSLYDLVIHDLSEYGNVDKRNSTRLWNLTKKDITLLDGPEVLGEGYEWGFGQAKFGKLFTSYDVSYYAYPWSMVIAADIYHEIFKSDPTNRKAARHFRSTVLEPGASVQESELLRRCLGRDFRTEPFFASIFDDFST